MTSFSRALATGFFVGYVPLAPGTAGSIAAIFLYWAIPGSESLFFIFPVMALLIGGAWAAGRVERELGVKDNQIIVIDEIVGTLVTLMAVEKRWLWLLTGLVLFRCFDILKPPPIRAAEKFAGGWGVMLDDLVAGLYAMLLLRLIQYIAGLSP